MEINTDDKTCGCYKASLTVEASFIMVITMAVLLSLFLVMFIVYHENVDFIMDKMASYKFDSVKAFRIASSVRSLVR